jgi:hypothetical protein
VRRMELVEVGGEVEEGEQLRGGGGDGFLVPTRRWVWVLAEEGGDVDREADALTVLDEVAKKEAAVRGEEHLTDELRG